MRRPTKYTRPLACGLLLALSGCSLDIQRLYGATDGGPDAPVDGGDIDGGNTDGGNTDGGVPVDAPIDPFVLSELDSASLGGPATSVAAARADGLVVVAFSSSVENSAATMGVSGDQCEIAFGTRSTYTYPGPVAAGVIDGMAGPDAVIASNMGITFISSEGASLIFMATAFPALRAVQLGEFDGDTSTDVILVGPDTSSVGLGDGDGNFGSFIDAANLAGTLDGAVADLNGDGDLDLVRIDANRVVATAGNGSGFFGPAFADLVGGPTRLTAGEIGGQPTLLVAGGTSLRTFTWAAAGSLVAATPVDVTTDGRDVVIANIDGVGLPEVVISDGAASLLYVLRWPDLEVLTAYPVTPAPSELAAVDADGDGDDEILVLAGDEVRLLSTGCP